MAAAKKPAAKETPVKPPAETSASEKPNVKLIVSASDTGVDTEESPRPLRDPWAPRPSGSSIYGFYGNEKKPQKGVWGDAYSVQAQNGDAEAEIATSTQEELDSPVAPAETVAPVETVPPG